MRAAAGCSSVLAPVDHYERHADLYAGTTLASVNFEQNFVVSAALPTLMALRPRLDAVSMLLPVAHAFHSRAIDAIESQFKQFVSAIALQPPRLRFYSRPAAASRNASTPTTSGT